jgi:hypothetical protein
MRVLVVVISIEHIWIFMKWDVVIWTLLSWLRIGTGGGQL